MTRHSKLFDTRSIWQEGTTVADELIVGVHDVDVDVRFEKILQDGEKQGIGNRISYSNNTSLQVDDGQEGQPIHHSNHLFNVVVSII